MSDRELLEAAARAAGYEIHDWLPDLGFAINVPWKHGLSNVERWNPLTDDGDALRLAVKRNVFFNPEFMHFLALERFSNQDKDDCCAYRRAIVRTVVAGADK